MKKEAEMLLKVVRQSVLQTLKPRHLGWFLTPKVSQRRNLKGH